MMVSEGGGVEAPVEAGLEEDREVAELVGDLGVGPAFNTLCCFFL